MVIGRFGEFSGIREKAQRVGEGESGRQRPRSRRFTASDGMQAPDTHKIIPYMQAKVIRRCQGEKKIKKKRQNHKIWGSKR